MSRKTKTQQEFADRYWDSCNMRHSTRLWDAVMANQVEDAVKRAYLAGIRATRRRSGLNGTHHNLHTGELR